MLSSSSEGGRNMKRLLLVVLPVSVLLSGGAWAQCQYAAEPLIVSTVSAAEPEVALSDPLMLSTALPADAAAPSPLPYSLKLASVNGISLADDLKTIYELKGEPTRVVQDEVLKSSRTYYFKDCTVGMSDGAVQNVVVPASAGQVEIDGQTFPLELNKLKEKLGTPFFISEDGMVYKNGYNALKIYLDAVTGQIGSVSYFHQGVQ
jgi:hypothetical protein